MGDDVCLDEEEDSIFGRDTYYLYNTVTDIVSGLAQRQAMSAIALDDDCFGCLLKDGRMAVLDIAFGGEVIESNCMAYFAVSASGEEVDWKPADIASNLLLLPLLSEDRSKTFYTMVNSEWEEMSATGEFLLPPKLQPRASKSPLPLSG